MTGFDAISTGGWIAVLSFMLWRGWQKRFRRRSRARLHLMVISRPDDGHALGKCHDFH